MSGVIRPFAAGDQANLIAVIDAVCGEGCWMSTRRFEPNPTWTHALTRPGCLRHLLLVVEVEEIVIGWCRLFPACLCNGSPSEMRLGIGLLQPYRDRGIGTALVHKALHWASLVEVPKVTLLTRPDNARAIHVFEKCGFGTTGHISGNLLEMKWGMHSLHPSAGIMQQSSW